MATNENKDRMTSVAMRCAMGSIDGARDRLMHGDWTGARTLLRDAIESAVIAEKWEALDRFAR